MVQSGVHPGSESQREDGNSSETRGVPQRAQSVASILPLEETHAWSFISSDELRDLLLKMKAQLFVKLLLDRVAPEGARRRINRSFHILSSPANP